MQKLLIVKIGGNIIDNEAELSGFLESFAHIAHRKILVHGGGKTASALSKQLGIEPEMVNGRRITDAETLKIVTMVYGGLINKIIVAGLQAFGCNAIGLTGADANILPAHKREGSDIDYGFVGDIENDKIPSGTLALLIENKIVPVFAPVTHDQKGQLLNTNADTIAKALAVALKDFYDVELIYCFEKQGVLKNKENENIIFETIRSSEYAALKNDGTITDGMIPKLDNAFDAITMGVKSVRIMHAHGLAGISFNHKPGGTLLYD
jgi:acetylglutamate kinase